MEKKKDYFTKLNYILNNSSLKLNWFSFGEKKKKRYNYYIQTKSIFYKIERSLLGVIFSSSNNAACTLVTRVSEKVLATVAYNILFLKINWTLLKKQNN